MEQFYNKHYIKVDSSGRIVDGWSDGPHRGRDTTDAICINDKGGYQFRLVVDGKQTEENPPLFDWNSMIPLYKWDGEQVVDRTKEEIEADRAALPKPEPSPAGDLETRVAAVESDVADLTAAVEKGLSL